MNEIRTGRLSDIVLPEYKASLVYGNVTMYLTKKHIQSSGTHYQQAISN